ncbi:MAG: hypothetical protein ACI4M8_00650 [Christensenellales bacterium]
MIDFKEKIANFIKVKSVGQEELLSDEKSQEAVTCPNCCARMEKSKNTNTAVCPYCGTQIAISEPKRSGLQEIIGFTERQINAHREKKEREERERKEKIERIKRFLKKYWWAFLLIYIAELIIAIVILTIF